MQRVTLYCYKDKNGSTVVTPVKPEGEIEFTKGYRLISSEGKMLTNDHINWYYVIDVESYAGWVEEEHEDPDYLEEGQAWR